MSLLLPDILVGEVDLDPGLVKCLGGANNLCPLAERISQIMNREQPTKSMSS
jgi:hypothetical protein